ncbi:hypothetical protein AAC387_Pa06g2085 [Persea americana]
MDLRDIGGKSLPDPSSLKKSSHLQGSKILQLVSMKDIYQSNIDVSISNSQWKYRLLRFGLTDGCSQVIAIEYLPIPAISEEIAPGTKITVLRFSLTIGTPLTHSVPFKFEAMWIQHPDFLNLAAGNWNFESTGNHQHALAQNLKSLKQALKGWNKQVFGDIKLKVRAAKLLERESQSLLDVGPSDSLHQSLAEAKASLHNYLLLQETHWHQKSRIRLLKEGDRNWMPS